MEVTFWDRLENIFTFITDLIIVLVMIPIVLIAMLVTFIIGTPIALIISLFDKNKEPKCLL